MEKRDTPKAVRVHFPETNIMPHLEKAMPATRVTESRPAHSLATACWTDFRFLSRSHPCLKDHIACQRSVFIMQHLAVVTGGCKRMCCRESPKLEANVLASITWCLAGWPFQVPCKPLKPLQALRGGRFAWSTASTVHLVSGYSPGAQVE